MSVKFGDYEVVEVVHFLLPENEEARYVSTVDGGLVDLKIRFVVDETEKGRERQALESGPNPDGEIGGYLLLTNWNQSRTANHKPFDFMERDGVDYHIYVSVVYANGLYDTTLQIMRAAAKTPSNEEQVGVEK